jgi:H+/Cl- antiporter ClcA
VGVAKLVAVTFSVCGGYRGGFIFPLFSAGAAFGRAISFVLPGIPVQLTTLCMAASLNVAITRTTLATTLILVSLSDEPRACSATLGASLVALFATGYMPFIKSQIARSDLDLSLYFDEEGEVTVVQQAVGEEVHV